MASPTASTRSLTAFAAAVAPITTSAAVITRRSVQACGTYGQVATGHCHHARHDTVVEGAPVGRTPLPAAAMASTPTSLG